MALLEFTDVRLHTPDRELIRAFALDSPRRLTKLAEEAVELNGWVIGQATNVTAVELRTADSVVARLRIDKWRFDVAADYNDAPGAERSGFRSRVDLAGQPDKVELQLVAVLADGSRAPLATIFGRRQRPSLVVVGESGPDERGERPIAELGDRGDSVVMPRCSIIVPVFNHAEVTCRCLDILLADTSPGPRFEVIVVDDGSTDDMSGLFARYGNRIRAVPLAQNVGFAGACNAGAAVARGDYLVFLNNDTLPQANWLGALVSHANVHISAAVVGARLLFPDDTIQHAGITIGLDRFPHHIYAGFPMDHPAVNRPRRFQAVTAACCLIRREAFEAVGGFDRAYVNGWEDVDLCLRLGERGYEIHYTPHCLVYHLESASRDRESATERHNRALFARRWRDRVEPDNLRFYVEDGLLRVANEAAHYPVLFEISPQLGTVKQNEGEYAQLLVERAEQVALLQEGLAKLNEKLLKAERRLAAAEDMPAVGVLA